MLNIFIVAWRLKSTANHKCKSHPNRQWNCWSLRCSCFLIVSMNRRYIFNYISDIADEWQIIAQMFLTIKQDSQLIVCDGFAANRCYWFPYSPFITGQTTRENLILPISLLTRDRFDWSRCTFIRPLQSFSAHMDDVRASFPSLT